MSRRLLRRSGIVIVSISCIFLMSQVGSAKSVNQDPNQHMAPRVNDTPGVEKNVSSAPAKNSARIEPATQAGLDIRIDLSNSVSTTAGNWNNISALTGLTSNLIDFNSGLGTGVSIDGTGSPWSDFFGDEGGTFPNRDWLIQPATVDGAGLQNGQTGSFAIAGLSGSSYQVEVVSARPTFGYLNSITVNGVTANRTYLGTPVVTPWDSTADGLTPGNWLIWDNVAPVSGVITITDAADNGTLAMLNALRISVPTAAVTAIPTVSEWGVVVLVLLLGAAAALFLRRRLF